MRKCRVFCQYMANVKAFTTSRTLSNIGIRARATKMTEIDVLDGVRIKLVYQSLIACKSTHFLFTNIHIKETK